MEILNEHAPSFIISVNQHKEFSFKDNSIHGMTRAYFDSLWYGLNSKNKK